MECDIIYGEPTINLTGLTEQEYIVLKFLTQDHHADAVWSNSEALGAAPKGNPNFPGGHEQWREIAKDLNRSLIGRGTR
jgi:hypothetical protein